MINGFHNNKMITLEDSLIKSIRNCPYKKSWIYICQTYILPEEFIIEFRNYVSWVDICLFQTLSEDFMREHQIDISWYYISLIQKLSKEFITEFVDKVDFHNLLINKKISQDIKDYCRMFI